MNDNVEHSDLRSRGYPIREDMSYQLKVWRFERCGWYLLVLVVVLSLAGLFSRGMLSSRDVSSVDGKLRVEYEVFHRNGSTNSMTISLRGAPGTPLEFELVGELLEGFSIETVQPQPIRTRSSAKGIRLWVQADNEGLAVVYFTLRGDGLGLFRSSIASPGSSRVNLDQFIYP
ncbi:hypothetical protein [Pseudomonas sp. NPDC086251]|uniref:hypothetical protein n=1 Tax=Pseudomonas sp. NPDC086251 TaxID=3364431 RepID=UPI0038379C81